MGWITVRLAVTDPLLVSIAGILLISGVGVAGWTLKQMYQLAQEIAKLKTTTEHHDRRLEIIEGNDRERAKWAP